MVLTHAAGPPQDAYLPRNQANWALACHVKLVMVMRSADFVGSTSPLATSIHTTTANASRALKRTETAPAMNARSPTAAMLKLVP